MKLWKSFLRLFSPVGQIPAASNRKERRVRQSIARRQKSLKTNGEDDERNLH